MYHEISREFQNIAAQAIALAHMNGSVEDDRTLFFEFRQYYNRAYNTINDIRNELMENETSRSISIN